VLFVAGHESGTGTGLPCRRRRPKSEAEGSESDPKADLELIWQYSHEHLDELRWALGELAGVHFG
jgi:hypothetical protein